MNSRPRVLVTGAQGLIAGHIVKQKVSDIEIIGSTRYRNEGFFLDLNSLGDIQKQLDHINPDCIVNCAGVTSILEAAENPEMTNVVNVLAVREISKWCNKRNARLIQFSTDFVHKGIQDFYSEQDQPHPLSEYGRSKLASEKEALEGNPNTVVIRTSLVYGYVNNLSRLNFPLFIKSKLEADLPLKITADQYRSPTYAGDIARAVVKLITVEYSGILNLAGPERISVFDFALSTCDAFSLNRDLLEPITTPWVEGMCNRPLSTGLNISKARNEIEFNPKTIDIGLKKLAECVHAN